MDTPAWAVRDVEARADHTLWLTFADGQRRVYDARPLLERPIYAALRPLCFFMRARADGGTVVWDDDTDIAPEHLYEHSVPFELWSSDARGEALAWPS
ncbi:MAG: DUF2442 domain-containing protein [Synergistaceae bacterium]|nr:DUF2442 domain-containing protein [Synergistaceae bacterium]